MLDEIQVLYEVRFLYKNELVIDSCKLHEGNQYGDLQGSLYTASKKKKSRLLFYKLMRRNEVSEESDLKLIVGYAKIS